MTSNSEMQGSPPRDHDERCLPKPSAKFLARLAAHSLWLSSNQAEGERLVIDAKINPADEAFDCRNLDLTKISFRQAYVEQVDFTGSDLTASDFCLAEIRACRFGNECNLHQVRFTEANILLCSFVGARLDPGQFDDANTFCIVWNDEMALRLKKAQQLRIEPRP